MHKILDKKMNTPRALPTLFEVGIVILSGFVGNYALKAAGIHIFALHHVILLVVAVLFRRIIGKWSLSDWGFKGPILKQLKMGLLLWVVVQTYYAFGHLFTPLFPDAAKMGAAMYKVTTLSDLGDRILLIAFFKAGIIETFRYFSYAEGLLMQAFGGPLGALMSFVYFGSAHMGIMNLAVLPVSFLFVYFYRTYKLVIPLVIFHVLGDAGAFTQMYLSHNGMHIYNLVIFVLMLALLFLYRSDITDIFSSIRISVIDDAKYLRNHKAKALVLSLVLPFWLHFLLYVDNHI